MKTVLLATPFLSNHFDAGIFWLAALGRERVAAVPWDYRREPGGGTHKADIMLALKTPLNPSHSYLYEKVCYWPDKLGRDPASEAFLKEYDRVYTCLRPTPPGMVWLPTGWDPTVHHPRVVPKVWHGVFIGTATPRKREFLEEMCGNTIFAIFGNGWETFKNQPFRAEPAYMDDYCEAMSRAAVIVNVHRDGDTGLNRRFFESMAVGFTLTDLVPGVEEVLGHELAERVGFRTPAEAKEKYEHYLFDHPDECEELWQAERAAIAPYTYDAAVRKVLELDT